LAEAQARAGDFASAYETANATPGHDRDEILAITVPIHAHAGHVASALKAASAIQTPERWNAALRQVAAAQAKAGDWPGAIQTLRTAARIDLPGYIRAETLRETVEVQFQRGDREGAMSTIAMARDLAQSAEYWSTQLLDLLSRIWAAQAKAGERQEALTTFAIAIHAARRLRDEERRAEGLTVIAVEMVKNGLAEEGLGLADSIITRRNEHLPRIAEALADAGDRESFRRLLVPCAYHLGAAYRMCALLARLYPEQSTAVAEAVMAAGPG
jgi:tetratricopeptide (TPR) repeat protein